MIIQCPAEFCCRLTWSDKKITASLVYFSRIRNCNWFKSHSWDILPNYRKLCVEDLCKYFKLMVERHANVWPWKMSIFIR